MVIIVRYGDGNPTSNSGRQFAFHIVIVHLETGCNYLFSLQLSVTSRIGCVFNLDMATSLREEKLEFKFFFSYDDNH